MIGKTTVPALKTPDLQGPTVGKAHDTTCSSMKMAIGCQEDAGEWRGPAGWGQNTQLKCYLLAEAGGFSQADKL